MVEVDGQSLDKVSPFQAASLIQEGRPGEEGRGGPGAPVPVLGAQKGASNATVLIKVWYAGG